MTATPGIGHNSRHDLDGYSGRLHLWRKARAELVPATMPVEVVRIRIRRARALGLDYGTYAGLRATTGRDIVALLFSSNALGMVRSAAPDPARAAALEEVAAVRAVLVHRPLAPVAPPPLDWAAPAPSFADSWSAMRDRLRDTLRAANLPADGVLIVGETAFEASWCAAARAAGHLAGARYFARLP